jgi:hypothetical protein
MQAKTIPQGQRVFTCGHSFHYFIIPHVTEMAKAAGIEDHVEAGGSLIGGSWVRQHWAVPDETNQAKAALKAGKVDVLTLSPIWLPDSGIEDFAKLAVAHNPKVRVFVQQYWMPNDAYEPVFPLDTKKVVDHDAANGAGLRACHEAYLKDIRAEVARVNGVIGTQAVWVVPVGQAVVALRERIIAGTAPGISTQAELFRDSWGHGTAPIEILSAYCHFAMIYKISPVGLPVASALVDKERSGWADERLTRLMQELAWAAVVAEPMSGVKA